MSGPELSHPLDVRQVQGLVVNLAATEAERAALSRRFALVRIDTLSAQLVLERDGQIVTATGTLAAEITQPCAVSGEDMAVSIAEPLLLRFVPVNTDHRPDEELEISVTDCDEIDYEGSMIDLGEAVAQSLALAIDPFATGPGAEEARRRAGIVNESASGPFAALAALKKDG